VSSWFLSCLNLLARHPKPPLNFNQFTSCNNPEAPDSNVCCGKSLISYATESHLTYQNFANFADYFLGQEWLDDGISTNQSMDWIQCESTHLTAFSVLLDPNTGIPIPVGHEQALSIITYIGSVCSIFGLFLTILTYSMFR
jgi:hypothetical protein